MRLYQQIAQSLAELWQPRWVRAEQPVARHGAVDAVEDVNPRPRAFGERGEDGKRHGAKRDMPLDVVGRQPIRSVLHYLQNRM